ncbi:hypothetical protein [Olleya sp. YS]|uniref:hypothetical protein n=1 Tax=Olleya sp. YS TaxID=3028318 RepID=UPI00243463E1|nr:hypothetical protein [Olleya sp. YS]WGD35150.1 hypothetical protein Ollyesu_01750 [Olleya sp. YS]
MKQLIIILYVLMSGFAFSQSGETSSFKESKSLDVVFSPSVLIQKEVFVDANIGIGEVSTSFPEKMFPIVGFQGFRIGLETNLKANEDFIIAPKLGYEFSITFFSLRLSALNYFQNNQSEFRLLPELGISLGGLVNVTYGYGIGFGQSINGISNHRLSLSFNLNKRLWNAVIYGSDSN